QQQAEMKVRPTVGMTFNNVVGDDSSTSDVGITAGAIVDFRRDSTLFATGALFFQPNAHSAIKEGRRPLLQKPLSIPAMGKTYFQGGQSGPYIRYGALFDVLMGAKLKNSFASLDMTSHMNTIDLLGSLGVGMNSTMDNHEFTVDFSLARSLGKI